MNQLLSDNVLKIVKLLLCKNHAVLPWKIIYVFIKYKTCCFKFFNGLRFNHFMNGFNWYSHIFG